MPFGFVNEPAIFITTMFYLCAEWQQLALLRGVLFNDNNNRKIIVEDLFNHTLTEDISFVYTDCMFTIAAFIRLSVSLPRSSFPYHWAEFVSVVSTLVATATLRKRVNTFS